MKKIIRQSGPVHYPMDPQKLQHFLAAYTTKNFRKAAEMTGVTQQAVSRSIGKLEDLVGLRLFERTAFGAEPTKYADTLARRAKIILAETRMAVAELSALRGSSDGQVRIGCTWTFMPRIAPDVVKEFKARCPRVGISIISGDTAKLQPALLNGDLDFIMCAPPKEVSIDSAIESHALFDDTDSLVMRSEHPLARHSEIELQDLANYTWIFALSLIDRWEALCGVFASAGVETTLDLVDTDSTILTKSLLANNDYLCLMSDELVAEELSSGRFVKYALSEVSLRRVAQCLTRRGSPLQPAAASLRSVFLSVCAKYYPNTHPES